MDILTCEKLCCKDSSGRFLLKNVSLEVKTGEKVAIIGPNGAGKSMLQKHLSGRLSPHSGWVKLYGKRLEEYSPRKRAQMMAVMTQSEYIEPLMSVREYVSLGRVPHQQKYDRETNSAEIERAINICKLGPFARQTIQTLSGGERQRASLARAIAQSSGLLLLDEPTNHLDPSARAEILDLVFNMSGTVLAIIHELSLVENFADRVIVLNHGEVVANGTPASCLTANIVRSVFGLDVINVVHPLSCQTVKIFETPKHSAKKYKKGNL